MSSQLLNSKIADKLQEILFKPTKKRRVVVFSRLSKKRGCNFLSIKKDIDNQLRKRVLSHLRKEDWLSI